MNTISDLLAKRRRDEPPEIRLIKEYVQHHFRQTVGVLVRERDIVVTVRSSALAGALRMHSHTILEHIEQPAKRLVFRVGTVGS